MIHTGKKMVTYHDYNNLPEGAPYQLIDGELVKSPSPTVSHQHIIKTVFLKLYALETSFKGMVLFAPIDVYLGETDIYQPDILFIVSNNEEIIKEKQIEGAPDIVVEVLSPSTAYYDLRLKKTVYEQTGVEEYWIIDPLERSVQLYSNGKHGFEQVCHMYCNKSHRGNEPEDDKKSSRPDSASHGTGEKVRSRLYPEVELSCVEIFGL